MCSKHFTQKNKNRKLSLGKKKSARKRDECGENMDKIY